MPTLIADPQSQYSARVQPVDVCTQEEFYDYQVEKLVSLKLARYEDADGLRKKLPNSGLFIFVPPPPKQIDLAAMMSKVVLDGRTGVNYLDPQYHEDLVPNPSKPSILADVEDGRGRLNVKPVDSRDNIKREGRQPFTTWHGLIHVILFPEVLKHHYIDLVGSRFYAKLSPHLCLLDDKPALDFSWFVSAYPVWGAASCGSVIVS